MSRWEGVREWIRLVFRRRAVEQEMEEELRFHLESEMEENLKRGMSAEEARAAATHAFGAADRFREETRDARGTRGAEDIARDVRLAFRGMRRTPGPAAIVILTMAIGIGASTAIFSVVKGVLLDPLPYDEPAKLVSVWGRFLPESGFDFAQFSLSPPEYFDYRAQNRSMEDVAAMRTTGLTLIRTDGEPIRIRAAAVTWNLFSLLRVSPATGRGFTVEEDAPGVTPVVVLSDRLWRSAFGGDPALAGRDIRINGRAVRVIGIMPPEFSFPSDDVDAWYPLGVTNDATLRQSHFVTSIARLRPGVTLESASVEMQTLMAGWKAQYPEIHTGHFLFLRRYVDDVVGDVRLILLILFGAVGVVLLICCANIASLLLARGAARRREVAVRAALGGSRERLAQQLLCESVVLALLGGAAGVVLARFAVRATILAASGSIPRAANIQIDAGVVLFAFASTFIAALLAGIAPALRVAASDPQTSLRDGDRSVTRASGTRFRAGLVTVQVALAVTLVTGAGLLVRSFRSLLSVDAGFRTDNVLVADFVLPAGDYPDAASTTAFFQELLDRLQHIPGVGAVSAVFPLPLYAGAGSFDFDIEGRPPRAPGEPVTNGDFIVAMPGYQDVLGIRMTLGRYFEPADRIDTQPVAVINQTAARVFWPGQNPIGQRIRMAGPDSAQWLSIIGIMDDVRQASLDDRYRPAWHIPFAQTQLSSDFVQRSLTFVMRTNTNPVAIGPSVRAILAEMDPGLPIIKLETFDRLRADSVAGRRFALRLLGTFATVALALSIIGLYGLLSFRVSERLRELGIRRALGARSASILGLVIRQGFALTAAGLALGIAIALPASRILRDLLFQTSPTDAFTFVTVSLALFAVAGVATLLPAARAVRMDPIRILRSDG